MDKVFTSLAVSVDGFITGRGPGPGHGLGDGGDRDVAIMGGGVVTAALRAGLLDEVILHQVPVTHPRYRIEK
jgi:hypothetical protein